MGIRKVFANFTSVVSRRSFSPRSMAPVNDRARPPWCAINYTVLTPREFGSRRARKDAFLESVWHNKRIPLVGSNEETKAARG
jgi:hypothetical protein